MSRKPGTYAVFKTSEGQIVCQLFQRKRRIRSPTL